MKISIIVPVYNAEKYIADCFYSIVNQTYKNIEAIFVDDCSIDNSAKILQKLIKQQKDSEIQYKIIKHEKNGGVHISRNTGMKESTGDYIFFIDNDDIITPNCIEYLLNFAKKHSDAEIIQGAQTHIDEDYFTKLFSNDMILSSELWKAINNQLASANKRAESEEILTGSEILKTWLQHSLSSSDLFFKDGVVLCGVWSSLYKMDFLKKNNIFFAEDLPIKEDIWFRYLCFKYATKITICYTPIYFYRMRQSSYSHNQGSQYLQIENSVACFEKMLPDIGNKEYDKECAYELAKWGVAWLKSWLLKMQTEKEKTLIPRYLDALNKINEKISNYQKDTSVS